MLLNYAIEKKRICPQIKNITNKNYLEDSSE
jgi:hypothetical protein